MIWQTELCGRDQREAVVNGNIVLVKRMKCSFGILWFNQMYSLIHVHVPVV